MKRKYKVVRNLDIIIEHSQEKLQKYIDSLYLQNTVRNRDDMDGLELEMAIRTLESMPSPKKNKESTLHLL